MLVDVDDGVTKYAEELGKRGVKAAGVVADVTTEAGCAKVAEAAKKVDGPVKFLGLVAGTLGDVGSVETIAMAEWDRIFGVNLRANVLMMKQFIPGLRAAGGGSIVAITSWYGRSGHAYFAAYCASKAALISLTQSAAAELAGDNIRVNSVAPGNVATRMHFTALAEEAVKRGISAEEMKAIEWAKIPARPCRRAGRDGIGGILPRHRTRLVLHRRHARRQWRLRLLLIAEVDRMFPIARYAASIPRIEKI